MGQIKREKTQEEIYQAIENWNFKLDGKITQEGIAVKTDKGIATIKRYWSEFKDYVKSQNKTIRDTFNPEVVSDIQLEEKVSQIKDNEEIIIIYDYVIKNFNYDADTVVELIGYATLEMNKSVIGIEELTKLKYIINEFITKKLKAA